MTFPVTGEIFQNFKTGALVDDEESTTAASSCSALARPDNGSKTNTSNTLRERRLAGVSLHAVL